MLRPLKDIFHPADYPDLLVGMAPADDAAIWKLDDHRSLVLTTDFFTPVVDDPYDYGAIAAANSLSDIYAMGGKPFLALNIAALPPDLPEEISASILQGGAEKVHEAGAVIAGGHTIQDKEPKYGLVVVGFVENEKMMTKSGAKPGDMLVLTKPLGFGVTTTALKRQVASEEDVAEVIKWMLRLNERSAILGREFALKGGTDITGFSLLGHAFEMAQSSQVGFQLEFSSIPFVSCARKYAEAWTFPGGASDNELYFGPHITFHPQVDEANRMLLFDPQTSGGLLLAVPVEKLQELQKRAKELEQPIWVIGQVITGEGITVNY